MYPSANSVRFGNLCTRPLENSVRFGGSYALPFDLKHSWSYVPSAWVAKFCILHGLTTCSRLPYSMMCNIRITQFRCPLSYKLRSAGRLAQLLKLFAAERYSIHMIFHAFIHILKLSIMYYLSFIFKAWVAKSKHIPSAYAHVNYQSFCKESISLRWNRDESLAAVATRGPPSTLLSIANQWKALELPVVIS